MSQAGIIQILSTRCNRIVHDPLYGVPRIGPNLSFVMRRRTHKLSCAPFRNLLGDKERVGIGFAAEAAAAPAQKEALDRNLSRMRKRGRTKRPQFREEKPEGLNRADIGAASLENG
jgi:hypothetical protein